MGQDQIYQFLKKHRNKWFASNEIILAMNSGRSSVSTCLRKLCRRKMVSCKTDPSGRKKHWYQVKN